MGRGAVLQQTVNSAPGLWRRLFQLLLVGLPSVPACNGLALQCCSCRLAEHLHLLSSPAPQPAYRMKSP